MTDDAGTPSIVMDFFAISNRLREIKGGWACTCRNATGHRFSCAIFRCSICGRQAYNAPIDGPAFCAAHCPDHDYRYDPGDGHHCVVCGSPPPPEWFTSD